MFAEEFVAFAISNLSLLAQDAPAPKSTFVQILENPLTPIIGLFFLFYFIFIVPERRKKAEEVRMMSMLKKNARVITIGGIHGTVVSSTPDSNVVTLRIDDNTRIKLNRTAIASVIPDTESSEAKNKESSSEAKDQ